MKPPSRGLRSCGARSKSQPKALTLEQIAAIRAAAANWRSEPGLPGPKPDGQVRDIIEAPDRKLWFSVGNGGLRRMDPQTGHVTAIEENASVPASLPEDFVTALMVDRSGMLWAGGWFRGVSVTDPRGTRFSYVFDADSQHAGGGAAPTVSADRPRSGALQRPYQRRTGPKGPTRQPAPHRQPEQQQRKDRQPPDHRPRDQRVKDHHAAHHWPSLSRSAGTWT